MPIYTREHLADLLRRTVENPSRVFLFFGERYLCQQTAGQLIEILLHQSAGTVHPIDGEQEDIATTCAQLRSFSLLPGRQIYRVTDTRLFLSKNIAKTVWDRLCKAHDSAKPDQARRALGAFFKSGGLDPQSPDSALDSLSEAEWQQCFGFARPDGDLRWASKYLDSPTKGDASSRQAIDPSEILTATLRSGLPANNFLILLAQEVDKRKKLFKLLKDEQTVIDLSVETGASGKAQKEQRAVLQNLLQQTLAEGNKTMAPPLFDLLCERVGFHPVALVMELRKVMAYLADRRQITREDLDLLVGRTRHEALFELTTAISQGNLTQTLALADRLQENGIHPLAIVSTLRNYVRGLLLCRSLLEQPATGFSPAMSAADFQHLCLPRLKEKELWKKELGGHPYALYMQFKTAASLALPLLATWMQHLLQAEFRLKGSSIAAPITLQHLLISLQSRSFLYLSPLQDTIKKSESLIIHRNGIPV